MASSEHGKPWPGGAADLQRRTAAGPAPPMRGYFGVGAEGIDKPMNLGNLVRSAHAFGASFVFLIESPYSRALAKSDTARSEGRLPVYRYGSADQLVLPRGCRLVGVELLDEAVDLPSFRHPPNAAYVFGPERSSLSPAMVARCDHVVRIPTRFCINLAVAGAVVMYDRLISLGRFAPRPVHSGGPRTEEAPSPGGHVRGGATVLRRAGAAAQRGDGGAGPGNSASVRPIRR